MNKDQWKKFRHDWRAAASAIYHDDYPRGYEERCRVEKYFEKAKIYVPYPANDIPYLWFMVKRAIQYGANKHHCFNAVRSYMRRNTYADPRQAVRKSHPCYWDNYADFK